MRTSRSLRCVDDEDPVEEEEFRTVADKRASIDKARQEHKRRKQELERQHQEQHCHRLESEERWKRKTIGTSDTPPKKRKKVSGVAYENKRTVKGAGGVEETVRTRPRMTKEIVDRLQRARGTGLGVAHRMLLLDTKQIAPVGGPDGACQEFTVLGATGNVHTCMIGRYHSCSCEDNQNNRDKFPCKHILFCYVRFLIPMSDQEEKDLYELRSNAILDSDCGTGDDDLSHPMPCSSAGGGDGSEEDEGEQEEKEEENVPKKPSGSGMDHLIQKFFPIWQRVLTIKEANTVLSVLNGQGKGVISQSALANMRLRKRYAQLKGTPLEFCPPAGPPADVGEVKQRPVEGDCPICAFEMSSAEEVVWCTVCGHNCHKGCMEAWAAAKRKAHGRAQCIFCRSLWQPGFNSEPSTAPAGTTGHTSTGLIGSHSLDPNRLQPSFQELYPNVPPHVLEHIVQRRNRAQVEGVAQRNG